MIRSGSTSLSLRFMMDGSRRLCTTTPMMTASLLSGKYGFVSSTPSTTAIPTFSSMQVRRFRSTKVVSTSKSDTPLKATTKYLTPEEESEILKKSQQIQQESAKAEKDEKKKDSNQNDPPHTQSAYQRLMATLKGLSFKELVKQYGIPLAMFYWITNESLVAVLTYLFHYNYLTTGDVVDGLKYVGLDSLVNIETIHSTSITLWGVEISALFLTNFLVASAVMSLFTPIQVPLCIAVFPYLRNGVRRVLGRKATATVVAAAPAAATATAV